MSNDALTSKAKHAFSILLALVVLLTWAVNGRGISASKRIAAEGTRDDNLIDSFSAGCANGDRQIQSGNVPDRWCEVEALQQTKSLRFAVIGDYGTDSTEEADVAELVAGWGVDFVITTGDNRYGSRTFDQAVGHYYCAFLADAGDGPYCSGGDSVTNAFFPSPGNHDYTDGSGLYEYLAYFNLPGIGVSSSGTSGSERFYDFVQGPIHFFVVDSQGALTNSADMAAQKKWLQEQLATSTTPWQIVIMHHPPYSSGRHGSTEAMQWPYSAWGVDFVLSGHDHTYERIFADGIVYYVNGLGGRNIYAFGAAVAGSQARYNSDFGAMVVNVFDGAINFCFVNRAGTVIDNYTYLEPASTRGTANKIKVESVYVEETPVTSSEVKQDSASTNYRPQVKSLLLQDAQIYLPLMFFPYRCVPA